MDKVIKLNALIKSQARLSYYKGQLVHVHVLLHWYNYGDSASEEY